MSGVEIVGLAIGVIPIVIEILRSYRTAKERIDSFRKHGEVVFDIQLRYRVAATSFSNDCRLLLKAVVHNAWELPAMLEDPRHDAWRDPNLESKFRAFLEQDYQLFEDIVLLIRNVLRDTQTALQDYERHISNAQSAAAHRFYLAFNVSLKENRYRQWLDTLDGWNNKLSKLREQRCKLFKPHSLQTDSLTRKAVPRKYSVIRTAAQGLHESLRESWSCTNMSHVGHQAKLSVEANAEFGNVHLDMVIACNKGDGKEEKLQLPPEVPIWLHVKTITTSITPAGTTAPTTMISDASKTSVQVRPHENNETHSRSTNKRRLESRSLSKTRSENKGHGPEQPRQMRTSQAQSFATLDLKKATTSICDHLSRSCASKTHCTDPCLGYLERLGVTSSSRLIFYDASKTTFKLKPRHSQAGEARSSYKLLQSLQTLHQLTLAHRLAIAMLQYHDTSWLPLDWSLRDMSYFDGIAQQQPDAIAEKLQSLHLSMQFTGPVSENPIEEHNQDLKYLYGIRNLPLAKLGVALLEIGCQTDIKSLNLAPTPHVVISTREILLDPPKSISSLGIGYLKILQKCIDCDFSCGDDLRSSDLRDAVYTDVVCGLESQIKVWKKFRGIE